MNSTITNGRNRTWRTYQRSNVVVVPATTVSFQLTASAGTLDWHTAPVRQLVITLSGTLDFMTRAKQHFILKPGIVLLAEDTVGGGHSWRLVDAEPWRRIYVVLAPGVDVPFKAGANW